MTSLARSGWVRAGLFCFVAGTCCEKVFEIEILRQRLFDSAHPTHKSLAIDRLAPLMYWHCYEMEVFAMLRQIRLTRAILFFGWCVVPLVVSSCCPDDGPSGGENTERLAVQEGSVASPAETVDPFIEVAPGTIHIRALAPATSWAQHWSQMDEMVTLEVAVSSPTNIDLTIVDHDSDWAETFQSHTTIRPGEPQHLVFGYRALSAQEAIEPIQMLLYSDRPDSDPLLSALVQAIPPTELVPTAVDTSTVTSANNRIIEYGFAIGGDTPWSLRTYSGPLRWGSGWHGFGLAPTTITRLSEGDSLLLGEWIVDYHGSDRETDNGTRELFDTETGEWVPLTDWPHAAIQVTATFGSAAE